MAVMTGWTRAAAKAKAFPENKYNFSRYLTEIGDWVETHPIPLDQVLKLKYAIYAWAWYHKLKVKTKRIPAGDGKYRYRMTLVKKVRFRDYE